MAEEQEGVIKYQLCFDETPIAIDEYQLEALNQCRRRLRSVGVLGADPQRYGGYGFGNISLRVSGTSQEFFITASQTGHLENLVSQDLAVVTGSDIANNRLVAKGLSQPSSESMTHAVLYDLCGDVGAVVHVHSPDIWSAADRLDLPSTSASVPYGTPEMAVAVKALGEALIGSQKPLSFIMKGHEDGVVVADRCLRACAETVLALRNKALKVSALESDG